MFFLCSDSDPALSNRWKYRDSVLQEQGDVFCPSGLHLEGGFTAVLSLLQEKVNEVLWSTYMDF